MAEPEDMSQPITRGEFRTELRAELQEALALWAGALEARFDAKLGELRRLLASDMAAQFAMYMETNARDVRVLDDKYADLPKRVTSLEDADLPRRVAALEVKAAKRRGR